MSDIKSNTFSKINYNPENKKLILTFRNTGKSYSHVNVPEELYLKFINSDSLGAFYVKNIKGKYQNLF